MGIEYVDEMIDVIYLQKRTEVDGRFDVLAGLKLVFHNLYSSERVESLPIEQIRTFVESSFENGHQIVLGRIVALQVGGVVWRLDFATAIDQIENTQLKQTDNEEPVGPEFKLLYEVDPDEPFSVDREREVIDMIKQEIEQCVNLTEKALLHQKVAASYLEQSRTQRALPQTQLCARRHQELHGFLEEEHDRVRPSD